MNSRKLLLIAAVVCAACNHGMRAQAASGEAMAGLTVLTPTGSFVVKPHENWAKLTGFGAQSYYVKMMSLMMVSGSGMHDMNGMSMTAPRNSDAGALTNPSASDMCNVLVNPAKPKPVVGTNMLRIKVTDGAGKPLAGLRMTATVKMASMDMGTTHPVVTEPAPGVYVVSPDFSMQGDWILVLSGAMAGAQMLNRTYTFQAGGDQDWSQPASDIIFTAQPQHPLKVGDNRLLLKLTTPDGKPLKDVSASAVVSMVSMNMGSTSVNAVPAKEGVLSLPVDLAMSGKWSVMLKAVRNGKVIAMRSIVLIAP